MHPYVKALKLVIAVFSGVDCLKEVSSRSFILERGRHGSCFQVTLSERISLRGDSKLFKSPLLSTKSKPTSI